jgi:hypothetical protein
MTLAVTRNLGRNFTLDLKYVGTLSRKLYGSMNLNIPNFLDNGLKGAFDAARAGGESQLLDQMFNGINIAGNGFGPVGTVFNGVPQTGALHLRAATTGSMRNNLANGDYQALANTLNTLTTARQADKMPVCPTSRPALTAPSSGTADCSPRISSKPIRNSTPRHCNRISETPTIIRCRHR